MNKWIKQHFTVSSLITLISIFVMSIAYAAVLNSDVQHLKEQVNGLPERLGRLEQKADDIRDTVSRIENYIKQ